MKKLWFALLIIGAVAPARASGALNDNMADAHVMSLPHVTSMWNGNASVELAEPTPPCGHIGHSLWFRYVPPADVKVTASTVGGMEDALTAVWSGASPSALAFVGCVEPYGPQTFDLEEGTTYWFQSGGSEDAVGMVRLDVQPVSAIADLALTELRIDPEHGTLPSLNASWNVHVRIANMGNVRRAGTLEVSACPETAGGCQILAQQSLDLVEGTALPLDFSWRFTEAHLVGKATVRAMLTSHQSDADQANNMRSVESFMLADAGIGARAELP